MTGNEQPPEQVIRNPECKDCPVKLPYCRDVLKGWKGHKTRRPVFVSSIVKMAVKHGKDMQCLRGDGGE